MKSAYSTLTWADWYLEYVSFNGEEADSPEQLHVEALAFANTMVEINGQCLDEAEHILEVSDAKIA